MATSSVVTTICDNCGAQEQRVVRSNTDDGWRSDLSTLDSYSNGIIYTTMGDRKDYCPACVKAVDDAIAAALAERKRAAAPAHEKEGEEVPSTLASTRARG